MKKKLRYLVALPALALFAAGCSSSEPEIVTNSEPEVIVEPIIGHTDYVPIYFTAPEQAAYECTEDFGFAVAQVLAASSSDNFLFSPVSASLNLAMLANGSQGETQEELCNALGLPASNLEALNAYSARLLANLPIQDVHSAVELSNAIVYDTTFNVTDKFAACIDENFNGELVPIESGWVDAVNSWAADKTHGNVSSALPDYFTEDLKGLAVLNALYFKGEWTIPFDPEATTDLNFNNYNGTVSKHAFMRGSLDMFMAENEFCTLGSLDFGNGAFSIVLMLPHEDITADECLARLDAAAWHQLIDDLEYEYYVSVQIPKVELSSKLDLVPVMQQCGVEAAFDYNRANFKPLAPECKNLEWMLQNSYFCVDESGAESSSVTSSGFLDLLNIDNPVEPTKFHLDRPFLFMITERSSGAILMMGRINRL